MGGEGREGNIKENFGRKLEWKSPFRRSRSRSYNFKETGHEGVDLINVACYRDRWQYAGNTIY